MLTVQGINAFEDNYIWLIRQPDKPQVAIVDPGDADAVITSIEAQSLEPIAILITHHHADHTAGIGALKRKFGCTVTGPAREAGLIPGLDVEVKEGDAVEIAFNAKYLIEVLSVVDTAQVALETTSPSSPGVLRLIGDEDFIHVIMPMHLSR